MSTLPNYQNASSAAHGTPAFETIATYTNQFLLAQNEPAVQQPVRVLMGDSLAAQPQFTVVGISGGKLVPAQWNATLSSAIVPIGVLAQPTPASGASNTTIFGEVFLEGSFNTDAESPLVWHSSFDTEAKRQQYNTVNSRLRFVSRRSSAAI
jgi:hypothetical protein